jgi:hypothetical protein
MTVFWDVALCSLVETGCISEVLTASVIRVMLAQFRLRNSRLTFHTGILCQLVRLPEMQVHLGVILMR